MNTTKKLDFVRTYLNDGTTYPDVTVDILPLGHFWEYISSTFLNGFINYVQIIKAMLITRYQKHEDNKSHLETMMKERPFHTNFRTQLRDDVLLLAEDKFHSNRYWFFWFDRDCSDCCIGRFDTQDDKATVTERFQAYCEDREEHRALDIPVDCIHGWISG